MNAEQSEAAYPIVQSVFDGHTSVQTGVARLHEVLSINRSSARYFIEVYACLRRGVVFNRALSAADMSYLLQRIGDEGGEKDLSGALSALRLHNAYREQSGVSQRSNREILDRETTRLQQMRIGMATPPVSLGDVDEMFLRQVQASLKDSEVSRQRRLALAPRTPRRIARLIYVYERNADVVAEVLTRARGVCERCATRAPFARRTDGTPYLEVHHVVPLADDGEDSVGNAIALCPNCHRYSHHGRVEALHSLIGATSP